MIKHFQNKIYIDLGKVRVLLVHRYFLQPSYDVANFKTRQNDCLKSPKVNSSLDSNLAPEKINKYKSNNNAKSQIHDPAVTTVFQSFRTGDKVQHVPFLVVGNDMLLIEGRHVAAWLCWCLTHGPPLGGPTFTNKSIQNCRTGLMDAITEQQEIIGLLSFCHFLHFVTGLSNDLQ